MMIGLLRSRCRPEWRALSGRSLGTVAALLSTVAPSAAAAQEQPILVIGERPPFGAPPERTLTEDDIAAYGIGTVGELLDEVAAENGETVDEPVILVNGERVASISDIEDYPPEVVAQVEVLPRGSGTKVGATADRRVYNVVLKRNAATAVGRLGFRVATEGGWSGGHGDLSYTRVKGSRRLNGAIRARRDGALLEGERDIDQPPGSPGGLGAARTLVPSLSDGQLSVSAADRLAPWLTGGVTGKLARTRGESLLGIGADSDLLRRTRSVSGNADLSLNADAGPWLFSLLGTYQHDRRRTLIDQVAGLSRTEALATNLDSELTAAGPVFAVPAGSARLTLGLGLGRDSISGEQGDAETDAFTQWSKRLAGGVEVPIASQSNDVLPALGELSASAQLSRTHVSDSGWFSNHTYALTWQPAAWLRLFGSITTGRTPPSVALVANPLLETPGVRYFDPLRDETVDVTEISGGNPELTDQGAANRRLTANVRPFSKLPLQLTAEYSAVRNRDIVTALPPASDLIFLAFPERFIRDPGGTLTIVDVRPVQFARESQQQLRTSLNLSLPLGAQGGTAPSAGQDGEDVAPQSARARGGRPRLQLNLSHSWLLESELLFRDGLDPIDLLSRDAVGLSGASRPRHQFDFGAGYSERGFGARLTGKHRGRSFLRLLSNGETDVLRFAPLTTFNLRSWVEPSRLAPGATWLKSARVTLSLLNLTNQRQRVTDSAGLTPLAYQQAYRDPLGRTVEIELRKAF